MAKTKNKKKISSDRIHSKKETLSAKKSLNPFEVHLNKEKLRVLGKKQKNDRGLPGVSRAKAIEKRKHTLLQEYKLLNKSNKFMDKRIGERNHNMTDEDRAMVRFTAVRVKTHNKKSIFNLADDEVLTHRGQTLSEIEKFDDPRSDDEESLGDGNDTGKLDKQFVEDAHFGGGILKKTGIEGAKTHRELIDQLIAESKKRKAEKQKIKEATLELTEKLDSEWKDLLPIVSKNKRTEESMVDNRKVDDYDKVMRELKFEARGTVSDRLKTEEELAKEQKEKLEELEKERLERMMGFVDEKSSKSNHRSADDLDDDFVYETDPEYMLSYNTDGESNVQVNAEINGKYVNGNRNTFEAQDDLSENEPNSEEVETDSEDNLSDLKEDSGDSESEDETVNIPIKSKIEGIEIKDISDEDNLQKSNNSNHEKEEICIAGEGLEEKIKSDLLKRKEIMEDARKELPYIFSLPESYESLQKTFENQSSSHQNVIIERMIKCNHPSLAEGNKDNLGLLFAYLLQYINDLFGDASDAESIKNSFDVFKTVVPQLYELAQVNVENTHNSIVEVIKEKHGEFKKKSKTYPGFENLIFLKLISLLFSTSDFRHQIVTPSFVFIEQMLNKCKVQTKRDISYGLFLTTLVLEYTKLSKRFLPAAINFLSGMLHMAIPKSGVKLLKVLPPFKSTSSLLVLVENYSLESFKSLHMKSTDLLKNEIDEEYKIRVLYNTIKLLEEFYHNSEELPSRSEIFEPTLRYLQSIPTSNYPKEVQDALDNVVHTLQKGKSENKLNYIVLEAKKPKALRLYEPKIEEVYDGKKFKVQSKKKAERDKMLHKLKKETKGALREIRRDKAFLGRVKIHQRIQSDKERREKVKRIYAEAAMQQSELNELDRKKRRKK